MTAPSQDPRIEAIAESLHSAAIRLLRLLREQKGHQAQCHVERQTHVQRQQLAQGDEYQHAGQHGRRTPGRLGIPEPPRCQPQQDDGGERSQRGI